MGLRRLAAVLLCLTLTACGRKPAVEPQTTAPDGAKLPVQQLVLKDRRVRSHPQEGDELSASISLLETGEAGIDRRIQQWVGGLCPHSPELKVQPDSAEGCLKLVMHECNTIAEAGDAKLPARCTYQAAVKQVYNDRYLLSLSHESYYDSGGAHGLPKMAYLNIDRKTGKTLALTDLIGLPAETLQGLLEKNLRAALNVPPQASLKASGFFDDHLPVTTNFAIDPEGLRFTYSAYEVAPYSMGLPNVRVPYADLAAHLAADSPLSRMWPP